MNAITPRRFLCFTIAAAVALSFTSTVTAQQRINAAEAATAHPVNTVALLSSATGLTEHQVKRALGAKTAWADNILAHDFADGRFRQMVGHSVYYNLKTQNALNAQDVQHLNEMAAERQARQIAIVK